MSQTINSLRRDMNVSSMELDADAFRNLDVKMKSDLATVEREIAKGKIMEAALGSLKGRPGFDPAALSISFGLKW